MSSLFLQQLRNMKCDVDKAMERCLDDEAFYRKCVEMEMEDECLPLLGTALAQEDYSRAFDYAHTLKGAFGNLGMTPLYDLLVPMVEELRAGKHEHTQAQYDKMMETYGEFRQMLKKC